MIRFDYIAAFVLFIGAVVIGIAVLRDRNSADWGA